MQVLLQAYMPRHCKAKRQALCKGTHHHKRTQNCSHCTTGTRAKHTQRRGHCAKALPWHAAASAPKGPSMQAHHAKASKRATVQAHCTIAHRVQNVLRRNRTAQQRKAKQTKRATRKHANVQACREELCSVQAPLAGFIIGPLGRRKAATSSQNFYIVSTSLILYASAHVLCFCGQGHP